MATGTVGAGRMGDYLAVRPAWPSKKLWAATGNVRITGGSTYDPYYAVFGARATRRRGRSSSTGRRPASSRPRRRGSG